MHGYAINNHKYYPIIQTQPMYFSFNKTHLFADFSNLLFYCLLISEFNVKTIDFSLKSNNAAVVF